MDQFLCHVWILPAFFALWLALPCQSQSPIHFRDLRVYPAQNLARAGVQQQLWRPVYRRAGLPLSGVNAVNPSYLRQPVQPVTASYLNQQALPGTRVYIQSVIPNSGNLQFQNRDLSYLIPKVTNSGVYVEPSIVAIPSRSRFENPSYMKIPISIKEPAQRFQKPSYLDPSKFRTPDMTLAQMEATLEDIERHIRAKEMGNPDEYTGSRVLILLLREQCARLALSGDPDISQFCSQFDSRFRSFLF